MSNLSSDDSSFATESEADVEFFWNQEPSKTTAYQPNYTTEVEGIIRENVNVTTANAIELNHHYQAKLRLLRTQLEILLSQCQTRLKEVDTLVDDLRHSRKETISYRARSPGYICGQPFFKDHELYPGPHNEDYLYRKNVQKEFFPLDMFELSETLWTTKDKQNMKRGIWVQALEFLRREGALRAKMCGSPTKAEKIKQEIASLNTLSLEDIWSKVQAYVGKYGGQTFEVDWLMISNVNIMGRHTASACEGLWNQYLKPGLTKTHWKSEEELKLVTLARDSNYQDWAGIARSMNNRSEYQCFVHFRANFSKQAQIERKPWTPEEDARLLQVVKENRIGDNIVWNKVVENMPYRNKIQVYHRYKYTLTRPLKRTKFTAEEDCIVTAYVQQYGDDFKYFPEQLLPGRTTKQVWARYNNTLRYVDKHAGWSLEEDKRLMSYIEDHLTEEGAEKISWSDCSRHLGNHARTSCRSRYYTIEKFLDKNPNATLEDVPRRERKKLSTDVTNKNWIKTIIDIMSKPNEEANIAAENILGQSFKIPGEVGLYEQMKFCFRYQFGYKLCIESRQRNVHTTAKIMLYLLEGFNETNLISQTKLLSEVDRSTMTAVMQTTLDWSSFVGLMRPKINVDGDATLFCRFPPNYNTVLGLRGACLNAYYEPTKHPTVYKGLKKKLKNANLYDQALELFVDRFQKLFYWSMLLTMLNIDDVKFVDSKKEQAADVVTTSDDKDELTTSSGKHLNKKLCKVVESENKLSTTSMECCFQKLENVIPSDHLVPIPIDNLSSVKDSSPSTPKNSIEVIQNVTIMDSKALPEAPAKSINCRYNNPVEENACHPAPEPDVVQKTIEEHHYWSHNQNMLFSDEISDQSITIKAMNDLIQRKRYPLNVSKAKDPQNVSIKSSSKRNTSIGYTDDIETQQIRDLSKVVVANNNQSLCETSITQPQNLSLNSVFNVPSHVLTWPDQQNDFSNEQGALQLHGILYTRVESNTITSFNLVDPLLRLQNEATTSTGNIYTIQSQHLLENNELGWQAASSRHSYNSTLERHQVSSNNSPLENYNHMCNTFSQTVRKTASLNFQQNTHYEISENLPGDEDIVDLSNADKIKTTPCNKRRYLNSLILEREQSIPDERIAAHDHGKEICIIREVDSKHKQSCLTEIITTNKCGDDLAKDSLSIERHDTEVPGQRYQENDHVTELNANSNAAQQICVISEVDDRDRHIIHRESKETTASRVIPQNIAASETFEQLQAAKVIDKKDTKSSSQTGARKIDTAITSKNKTEIDSFLGLTQPLHAGKCHSLTASKSDHYNELLNTIDESFNAVDIIRMLAERRQTEDEETSIESEVDEVP